MTSPSIPYRDIETVFLDAGNTFVQIDFERVVRSLEAHGVHTRVDDLIRAEAKARPRVSLALDLLKSTEGRSSFAFYLDQVMAALPVPVGGGASRGAPQLADRLAEELLEPGHSDRLWCRLMPGTESALTRLAERGYRLCVVSNSDGTMLANVERLGLSRFFHAVCDSGIVGVEKPHPDFFAHALGLCQAQPSSTLHVGDLYGADVVGARSAGLHAALLDPHDDWLPYIESGDIEDCERVRDLADLADRLGCPAEGP